MKKYILFTIIVFSGLWFLNVHQTKAAPLTIHPSNPRYFTDGSGKAVYLTGSHTWNNLQDNGTSDPPYAFDYNGYLNFMQSYNHNFMRMWVFEVSKNMLNPPPAILAGWYAPLPYVRTGPGTALDGKPKFDLNQLNQAYFDRLRARVIAARDKGIYVSIMLFEEWGCSEPFSGCWYNINNNINGVNGDPNNTNCIGGSIIHRGTNQNITNIQKLYVKKVIDTVNDLDNVLYEIANETNSDSTAWQYDMINYIKNYEAGKPKQHPVGMTFQYPGGSNSTLFNSPADWISPNSANGYDSNPPAATGAKVIIADTDHIQGWPNPIAWIWQSFLRGLNPILMDFYDYGDPKLYGSGWYSVVEQEAMRNQMGYTLTYANKMNLAAMTPQNSLSSTAYCLANQGQEYLVFQPNSGSFTVNLVAGTYTYEWFNLSSGIVAGTGSITASGGSRSFTPPFSGNAVLYLKKTSVAPYCGDTYCNGTETCSTCPADCGVCPSTNPIAWWKFDETSGTTASDSSGNNNNGTLVNGPVWTTGKLNGGLSFDGVNDYVNTADSSFDLERTNSFSVATWIKTPARSTEIAVITKEDVAPNYRGWSLYLSNSGTLKIILSNAWDINAIRKDSTAEVDNNSWHHVAFTYNGTSLASGINIYIDGVLSNGSAVIDSLSGTILNNHNLEIGSSLVVPYYFPGSLDEVRVYNRVLSQSEIQTLYNAGSDTTPPAAPTGVVVN